MFQEVVFCFVLFLSLSLAICGTVPSKTEPALLVVSYDAFRPEYLHRNVTPNLNKFRQEGVSAPFMFNVFPTKTFVNHFSIATVSQILRQKQTMSIDELNFLFCNRDFMRKIME